MTTKKHHDHHEPGSSHERADGGPPPMSSAPATAGGTPEQVHITGRVIDVDCHPIRNMRVSAAPARAADAKAGAASAHTEEDGRFTLAVPRGLMLNVEFPGQYMHAERLWMTRQTTILCQPHRHIDLGDLVYQPLNSGVSGRVQRVASADPAAVPAPLAGVPVELLDARGNTIASTTSADDGTYTFSLRHGGMFCVSAPADWQADDGLLTLSAAQPMRFYRSPEDPLTLPPITYELAPATVTGQVTDGQRGIAGVTVTLDPSGQRTTTDKSGIFRFEGLTPGSYTVQYPATAIDGSGESWELAAGQQQRTTALATGGQVTTVAPVAYDEERHLIEWAVYDGSSKASLPNIMVELCTPDGKRALRQQLTDTNGNATFELERGGDFLVRVYGDPPSAPIETPVSCNSRQRGGTALSPLMKRPRAGGVDGAAGGGSTESLIDLTAYPIMTEDVSQGGGVAISRTGADASVGLTASQAISSVLSWRAKPDDTPAFLAALKNVFDLKDVEGHVEWTYNASPSFSANADLGAITGAQASILKRAQTMIDESCRILKTITPLRPDADPVDCASILSIITDELGQIPDALSLPSGPIVERMDELFRLLGAATASGTLEGLTGQLQQFRDRYGMDRRWVNTIEQEQTLTDFITVVDYVTDLYKSWQAQRNFFSGMPGSEPPFLGTILVTLSRLLGVIGDRVSQVRYVLESVFIPQAELATIQMQFTSRAPMYFEDLLGWIESSSADAATQMRQNGKDAVMTYARTAELLHNLVRECRYSNQQALGNTDVPKAFASPRVERALKELAEQLDEIRRQARQVNRKPDPRVTTIIPALQHPNGSLPLQLFGSGFQTGATVTLTPRTPGGTPIAPQPLMWVNSTYVVAKVPLPVPHVPQLWRVAVLNPDGGTWESRPGEEVSA